MNQQQNCNPEQTHQADCVTLLNESELFTRHSDTVLCCSIDTNNRLAVSGGIDDTAFVWDLKTKHVIFESVGHKESVVAVGFSANSTYVATGDLNGYIQVRNTTTGIKIFDYEIDEINWIRWHNTSDFVLLAGTTKGDFWMWNVNDPAAVKTFPSYGSGTTTAKLLADGLRIVVAYQDGSIRLFDLKSRQLLRHLASTEQSEIISLDVNPNNSLLAIGCIDSSVKILTMNGLKVINSLKCESPQTKPNQNNDSTSGSTDDKAGSTSLDNDECMQDERTDNSEDIDVPQDAEPLEVIDEYSNSAEKKPTNSNSGDQVGPEASAEQDIGDDVSDEEDDIYDNDPVDNNSVESVLFSPCGNFLAASNNSGTMIIWDVTCQSVRCESHTGVGITRCAWTPSGQYITGCLDGFVRIFDVNLNLLEEISAHLDQILDVVNLGRTLITASEDKTCRVIELVA